MSAETEDRKPVWPSSAEMMTARASMVVTVIVLGIALLWGFERIFDVAAGVVLVSTGLLYCATRAGLGFGGPGSR